MGEVLLPLQSVRQGWGGGGGGGGLGSGQDCGEGDGGYGGWFQVSQWMGSGASPIVALTQNKHCSLHLALPEACCQVKPRFPPAATRATGVLLPPPRSGPVVAHLGITAVLGALAEGMGLS